MAETKSLCALIPIELHNKVTASKDESGLTLNQYVEKIITEYYELKERKNMNQIKTLAIQIEDSLFQRLKEYVDSVPHLTQKAFITELITKALDELAPIQNNEQVKDHTDIE